MTLLIYFAVLEVISLIKPMSKTEIALSMIIGIIFWLGHLTYWSNDIEHGGKK